MMLPTPTETHSPDPAYDDAAMSQKPVSICNSVNMAIQSIGPRE